MSAFVLCKKFPDVGRIVFVCGTSADTPGFNDTPERASRFDTREAALEYRSQMGHQLGGTDEYHVHELLADGRLVDAEG